MMRTKPIILCIVVVCAFGCQSESEVQETMSSRDIKTVMDAHVDDLMSIEGVTAVAIGVTDGGTPCVKVYVLEQTPEIKGKIPTTLEGHPVLVEVSGEIKPMGND